MRSHEHSKRREEGNRVNASYMQLGSSHHPSGSTSATARPYSSGCRGRHLDTEIREDPDHGPGWLRCAIYSSGAAAGAPTVKGIPFPDLPPCGACWLLSDSVWKRGAWSRQSGRRSKCYCRGKHLTSLLRRLVMCAFWPQ
ncbi:hypothetical protein GOODEAATRI_014235 [Goodea atripinnis]|uniref:Uncharacterized protein n=1 Tax=Goodea atripinnis TaxID=208336 RepID=A0ABV0MRX9_9TELE